MATLPTIGVGNSTAPSDWQSAPNGALTLIGAGGQDTNNGHVSFNSSALYNQGWILGSMPGDFESMDTAAVQLRYAWSATPSNTTWPLLAARIMSGATVLAAANSGGAFQAVATSIAITAPDNSSVVGFSYVNTAATKTQWDAGVLEVQIERERNKGGGNEQQRVYAAQVTGTYTEETVTEPVITSVTPDTFDNGATGVTIIGTDFGASKGIGKVELGNASTYGGSTTLVEQADTLWADTSITFTAVKGDLEFGGLWLYVTNNSGGVSTGEPVTLTSPPPGLTTDNLKPTASAHDAFERNDNTNFDSTATILAAQSAPGGSDQRWSAGVYLPNSIPKYAEIESAKLSVWPLVNADAVFSFVGNYATPADFSTNADVTVRLTLITLAAVGVENRGLATGQYVELPQDFWAVIQEMVNAKDWTDDNALVPLFIGFDITPAATLWWASWDEDPAKSTLLTVKWRVPLADGKELEEIFHPFAGRSLGSAAALGDPLGFGDPDVFVDPVDGIKKIAVACNRAGIDGVDMYIVPFDADTDDWDLARTDILNNINVAPIVTRPGTGWDSYRIESPAYVRCHDTALDETVDRIYYVGGDTAGVQGPYEIGFLQRDSTTSGAWVRHGDPVLSATEDWEDWNGGASYVFEPSVIYDESLGANPFRMLYSAGNELKLAMADSADGITWTNKVIFFESAVFPAWSATWHKVNNHYEMITSAISKPGQLARTWSPTPSTTFEDWSAFEVILLGGAGQRWHSNWVYGPAVALGDDGREWVYFTGRDPWHQDTYPHVGRLVITPMVTAVLSGALGLATFAPTVTVEAGDESPSELLSFFASLVGG